MKAAELEFSEHNFNVLKEAYGELKQQYLERGMAMRKTGDQVRSIFTPLKLILELETEIGADGTTLKCTCGKDDCHKIYCSAGDRIFKVSYTAANEFDRIMDSIP